MESPAQLPPPLHTCSQCKREISCVPCGCRFCERRKDEDFRAHSRHGRARLAPEPTDVGTMCRLARINGKRCGPYPEIEATGAVQEGSSDTALEASMVQGETSKADVAEANEYLSNLVPTSLTESRWSRAVALHVPKMRRWWRSVASSLTDSALMKARRRQDLSFMLGAVVGSQSEQEQAAIVETMREWSNDFLDKEGRLKGAMLGCAHGMGIQLGRKRSGPQLGTVPADVRAAVKKFRLPPKRLVLPSTEGADPDRNPRHGFAGVITIGEFAAGSGSFVRYAQHLGAVCKWVAEKVPELEVQAAKEAGAQCKRLGDVLLVHPTEVDEVFMLVGGPECQPFSAAGKKRGLQDPRARTFFWVLWCLAIRQFPSAFIENVAPLLTLEDGAVWALLKSIAVGIGYQVQTQTD